MQRRSIIDSVENLRNSTVALGNVGESALPDQILIEDSGVIQIPPEPAPKEKYFLCPLIEELQEAHECGLGLLENPRGSFSVAQRTSPPV